MSKPLSGLFEGTQGFLAFMQNAEDVISQRVNGLDLSHHSLAAKQLSKRQLRTIKKKIDARTATREEYSAYDRSKRFAKRRARGVKRFWSQERRRLKADKKGTRNWTEEQRKAILAGKVPRHNGRPIQGHHSYSASVYPHLADRGEVIYPVTYTEHLQGWHGGNYKDSLPGKPIRYIFEF